MSDDEAAFLAKIIAQPEDDTVRLVYADWLQENGQEERAEFIRVQIEIERKPSFVAPELCPLRARERDLFAAACSAQQSEHPWLDVLLPHYDEVGGSQADYRRGFVESLTCTAADWLAHGDAIRAAHPMTRVVLVDGSLLIGRNMLVQLVGGVNEWKAVICYPDEGYGQERWPGVTFELPRARDALFPNGLPQPWAAGQYMPPVGPLT